jgi:hypothetical protein
MSAFIDLTGRTFGQWTVIRRLDDRKANRVWLCRCACGNEAQVRGNNLKSGKSIQCLTCAGWAKPPREHIKHGEASSPAYAAYHEMHRRCYDPRRKRAYYLYGARGIKVCERWHTFPNFLADMGQPPKGLSLDRIDPDKDYAPDNCRWADSKMQARNQRDIPMLTYKGQTKRAPDWADEVGLPHDVIHYRLSHGWSVDRTLSTPLMPNDGRRNAGSTSRFTSASRK